LTQGSGNTNNFSQLYVNNSGTTIVNNILGGIAKTWTFGTDGVLTLPSGAGFGLGNSGQLKVNDGITASLDFRDTSGRGFYTNDDGYALRSNGNNTWQFGTGGSITFPDNTVQTTAWTGTVAYGNVTGTPNLSGYTTTATVNTLIANSLTNVATQFNSSWTLAAGANTVSFTLPGPGTYAMWVTGNIANGIAIWNATGTLSNNNVPVIGQQFGWYYSAGNALVLTSIPAQIIGTAGVISSNLPAVGTTTNVFTFGITNNSGSSKVVYWGYTKL
jgi:hypothetical protein